FNVVDVRRGVNQAEGLAGGGLGFDGGQVPPHRPLLEMPEDGRDPVRALRMIGPGVVEEECWVKEETNAAAHGRADQAPVSSSLTLAAGSGETISASPISTAWTPS